MWTCSVCGEQHEAQFEACWRCTTPSPAAESAPPLPPEPATLNCLRCPTAMEFVGTRKFHEGTRWGAFGELGELFVNRERFDVYLCPRCGRVELFVDGVGEDLRPRNPG